MRFKVSDIGCLVRPKTITHLLLWEKKQANIDEWWKTKSNIYRWNRKTKKTQLTTYYKLDLETLFQNLSLGNPVEDPARSYVAKITSFLVLYNGSIYYINSKEKARIFEKKIEKCYGKNPFLPIVAVGLKFYRSVYKTKNCYEPLYPWEHTHNDDVVWFYRPNDLIPLDNIIVFEKYKLGDMIKFKKTSGIIIKEQPLVIEKFYNKNSAVTRNLYVLTPKLQHVKLLPSRKPITT